MRAKSRMSLVSWISASLLSWIVCTNSRCSGVSGVSSSRLVKPRMPLSGVRTSWLMVARNWLFAVSPASARSLASRSTPSVRRTSVRSSKDAMKQASRPLRRRTGVNAPRTG